MSRPLRSTVAALLLLASGAAQAADPVPAGGAAVVEARGVTPAKVHPNPRLKLAYRRFAIANLDGSSLWLDGAQLDGYPLSRRYIRAGIELEGGAAKVAVEGQKGTFGYGLLGLSAGFQYPARVTPFVEGRFAGGVLGGRLESQTATALPPGVTLPTTPAATWIYLGGIEAGVELYAVSRVYVSAAIGWTRSTWHGLDYAAMKQNPIGGVKFKDLTGDSVALKIGFGL